MWYSGISVISLSIFHGTTSSLCPVIVIARGSTTSCVIWYGHVEVKDAIDVLLPSRYYSSNIVNGHVEGVTGSCTNIALIIIWLTS